MKIAVASGKGGTGKTTVAASLALSLHVMPQVKGKHSVQPQAEKSSDDIYEIQFLDCDVEAPNAHLFFKFRTETSKEVNLPVPKIDSGRCTHCGTCSSVCQYHAITVIGKNIMVFPQLCHGCGSCKNVCPEGAIDETPSPIGRIEKGTTESGISFSYGLLNIGEPMSVPIIRQLKKNYKDGENTITILDSPPGNSCPMVETIRDVDFVILVTEPTPFGLHDLKMAVDIIKSMHIPGGIVLNRAGISQRNDFDEFVKDEGIPVLLRIPYQREIAEATARGQTLIEVLPEYRKAFQNLIPVIHSMVEKK